MFSGSLLVFLAFSFSVALIMMWYSARILFWCILKTVLFSSFFQDSIWFKGSSLTSSFVDILDFSTKPMVLLVALFFFHFISLGCQLVGSDSFLRIQFHFNICFLCFGIPSLICWNTCWYFRFWLKAPFNYICWGGCFLVKGVCVGVISYQDVIYFIL